MHHFVHTQGPVTKDVDAVKESLKPERAPVFGKRSSRAAAVQLKKPTSSVEADITGGSSVSSQAQPKQETSTATSKNYKFKKGNLFYLHFFKKKMLFLLIIIKTQKN